MSYKTIGSGDYAMGEGAPLTRPSGVWTGDLTIRDRWEAFYYGLVTEVTGNLEIWSLGECLLTKMAIVGGGLTVGGTGLTSLEILGIDQ